MEGRRWVPGVYKWKEPGVEEEIEEGGWVCSIGYVVEGRRWVCISGRKEWRKR